MTSITKNGFQRTRLSERLKQLQDSMRAIFGPDINLDPDTVDGETLGIFAQAISSVDELAQYVYESFNPQTATGVALSRLVQLNGIRRSMGTYSSVELTLCGNDGVIVPKGSLVSSSGGGAVFALAEDVSLLESFPQKALAYSTSIGPVYAKSNALTQIQTPIYGWKSVTNTQDATPGSAQETDEDLRLRRAKSVAMPSQGILDGLYAGLANLDGVSQVCVYENDTASQNSTTQLPPHSIEVVVSGGEESEILKVLWLKKSAGVTTVGNQSGEVFDSQGISHILFYSRPSIVDIYVSITGKVFQNFPFDGKEQMTTFLLNWFQEYQKIGRNVIPSSLYTPLNQVPGTSIDSIKIGLNKNTLSENDIVISHKEIASLSKENIFFQLQTSV